MSVKVLGLCRGSGKGYIKITTDLEPESLQAKVATASGTDVDCPILRIGFPGEDPVARRAAGDPAEAGGHVAVVVVPLLEGANLDIRILRRDGGESVGVIPFKTFETKVRSRLTYK